MVSNYNSLYNVNINSAVNFGKYSSTFTGGIAMKDLGSGNTGLNIAPNGFYNQGTTSINFSDSSGNICDLYSSGSSFSCPISTGTNALTSGNIVSSGTINCGTHALTSGNISSGSVNCGSNSITSGSIISSGTINISDTSSTLLPAQLYSTSLGVGSANGLYLGKNVTQSLYLGYSYQGNYNNANELNPKLLSISH